MTRSRQQAMMATRILDVDGQPGYRICIAQPFLEADGITWRCEYAIAGPLTQCSGGFSGVDAMQALLNVLYALSVEVETSEENRAGRLGWHGQKAHFGFPAPEANPDRHG